VGEGSALGLGVSLWLGLSLGLGLSVGVGVAVGSGVGVGVAVGSVVGVGSGDVCALAARGATENASTTRMMAAIPLPIRIRPSVPATANLKENRR
jgi:hypothetical protein